MGSDHLASRPELIAALSRMVGAGVQLHLEAPGEAGQVSVRGILVSAFDQLSAPDEGNLMLLVGPHLVEIRFGRIEYVQLRRPSNGSGGSLHLLLLLEGESVMKLGPSA